MAEGELKLLHAIAIGAVLRKLRKQWNLTHRQVADQAGMAQSTISRWEAGTLGLSVWDLTRISAVLSTSPTAILADALRVVDIVQQQGDATGRGPLDLARYAAAVLPHSAGNGSAHQTGFPDQDVPSEKPAPA